MNFLNKVVQDKYSIMKHHFEQDPSITSIYGTFDNFTINYLPKLNTPPYSEAVITEDDLLELYKITATMGLREFSVSVFNSLDERNLFQRIMDLPLINKEFHNPLLSEHFNVDEHCIFPKLTPALIDKLTIKRDFNLEGEEQESPKTIAIEAPTGSGKTARICQFIVENDNYGGVILVHSNDTATELKDLLRKSGYEQLDKVVIYNSDDPSYWYYRDNPRELLLNKWIICYNKRLFGGNIEFFLNNVPQSITNLIIGTECTKKIVFIDECPSKPLEYEITYPELDAFSNLVGEIADWYNIDPKHKIPDKINWTSLEFWTNTDISTAIIQYIDSQANKIGTNVNNIKHLSFHPDKLLSSGDELFNKSIDQARKDMVLKYASNYSPQLFTRNIFYNYVREQIYQDSILLKLFKIFIKDNFVVDKLDLGILKHRIKYLFKMLRKATIDNDSKCYYNFNNLIKEYNRYLTDSKTVTAFKYYIGLDSVARTYPIIIMDANATLNYKSAENIDELYSFDKLLKVSGTLKASYSSTPAVIRSTGYGLGSRRSRSDQIEHKLSQLLESGEFTIKNNSVVLWFMDWKKGDFNPAIFIKKYAQYYNKNIQFIHYGSGDLKGTNKYLGYENIYILGQFFVNSAHIAEHKIATGSTDYNIHTKTVTDIIQAVGRLTRSKRKLDGTPHADPIGVYFVDDFDFNLIESVRQALNLNYDENDINTLRFLINLKCRSDERSVRSTIVDNMIAIVKSHPHMFTDKVIRLSKAQIAKILNVSKFRLAEFNSYRNYFGQLGIDLVPL